MCRMASLSTSRCAHCTTVRVECNIAGHPVGWAEAGRGHSCAGFRVGMPVVRELIPPAQPIVLTAGGWSPSCCKGKLKASGLRLRQYAVGWKPYPPCCDKSFETQQNITGLPIYPPNLSCLSVCCLCLISLCLISLCLMSLSLISPSLISPSLNTLKSSSCWMQGAGGPAQRPHCAGSLFRGAQ